MAVLLRDLRIVKVCGGSHGGSQRGKRARGRQSASSGGLGVCREMSGGDEMAGWTSNTGGSLKQRGKTDSRGVIMIDYDD